MNEDKNNVNEGKNENVSTRVNEEIKTYETPSLIDQIKN